MVGGDDSEIEDDEPGLASVEEEVLQVHRHAPIRDRPQHDRGDEIDEDEAGRDDPGLHQSPRLCTRIRTPMRRQ